MILYSYLKSVFTEEGVQLLRDDLPPLPPQLTLYDYGVYAIGGKRYVFVTPKGEFLVSSYISLKRDIETLFGMSAVLVLRKSFDAQRKNLTEHRVFFVEPGKQLFLPSAGVILQRDSVPLSFFTPQSQLCALFFLYTSLKSPTVKDLTSKLNLNEMAVSRAVRALLAADAITSESHGRTQFFSVPTSRKEYIERIEPFCIRPIAERAVLLRSSLPNNIFSSGLTALARYTNTDLPSLPTYAMYKRDFASLKKDTKPYYDGCYYTNDYAIIESWRYPPDLFGSDGITDPFSLYLSFDQPTLSVEKELAALKQICYRILIE